MIKNGTGTEQAWAVFNKDGRIVIASIRTQRKETIAVFLGDTFSDWDYAKKTFGVYVAKVEVTAKAEVKG